MLPILDSRPVFTDVSLVSLVADIRDDVVTFYDLCGSILIRITVLSDLKVRKIKYLMFYLLIIALWSS